MEDDLQIADASMLLRVSHVREVRAVWVASVDNIDVPSAQGLDTETLRAELLTVVQRADEAHLNTLYFQVRPEGDALYASAREPWSRYLSGEQGVDPGLDPLQVVLDEAHRRGLRVVPWLNPFRAALRADDATVSPHVASDHPDQVVRYSTHLWMDPGRQEVQDRTLAVTRDLLQRYDVDGVHIDDYFYPYPAGQPFPDQATFAASGADDRDSWRRGRVDAFVQAMHGVCDEAGVPFSVSPFGLYRPGHPAGTKGFDQVKGLHADPVAWMRDGVVDEVVPQLYWSRGHARLPFDALAAWWCAQPGSQVVLGHALYKMERGWTLGELSEQVRVRRAEGCAGDAWFSWKYLGDSATREHFSSVLYPRPALPPARSNGEPPTPRLRVRAGEVEIVGEPGARGLVVYERDGKSWRVRQVLGARSVVVMEGDDVVVTAVDALARESVGVRAWPVGDR